MCQQEFDGVIFTGGDPKKRFSKLRISSKQRYMRRLCKEAKKATSKQVKSPFVKILKMIHRCRLRESIDSSGIGTSTPFFSEMNENPFLQNGAQQRCSVKK